jgi:hypothetical protein
MDIDGKETKKHGKKTVKKNKFSPQWIIVAIIIGVAIGYILTRFNQPAIINQPRTQKNNKVSFVGGAIKKLGNQGMELGLRDLSQQLINLMNVEPNKTSYQINYTTAEEDLVDFGYDLKKQTLVWMLSTKDGHLRLKAWTGHIQYRLIAASNGRSLNDTPDGKSLPSERQY